MKNLFSILFILLLAIPASAQIQITDEGAHFKVVRGASFDNNYPKDEYETAFFNDRIWLRNVNTNISIFRSQDYSFYEVEGVTYSTRDSTLDALAAVIYSDAVSISGDKIIVGEDTLTVSGGGGGGAGAFDTLAGVVLPSSMVDITTDDFVFGSDQLDDDTDADHDNRIIFDKSKAFFAAGQVQSDQWDDINRGLFSTSLGRNNEVDSDYSLATGYQNTISGNYNFASGSGNQVSGQFSASIGSNNVVTNSYGVALGSNSSATSEYSFAFGRQNYASASYSACFGGYVNRAKANYSATVGGRGIEAESYAEIVIGTYNTDYTPNSTTSLDSNDRAFSVGNGVNGGKSDAFTILKDARTFIGMSNAEDSTATEMLQVNGDGLFYGHVKIVDGNEAEGKVLTSDSLGVGTWQDIPSLGDGNGIYDGGGTLSAFPTTSVNGNGALLGVEFVEMLDFKIETSNLILDAENDLTLIANNTAGTSGQVLTSDGTNASWQDAASGGGSIDTLSSGVHTLTTDNFRIIKYRSGVNDADTVYIPDLTAPEDNGKEFRFKEKVGNTSTRWHIATIGADKIDNSDTFPMDTEGKSITLYFYNDEFYIE